MNRVFVLDPEFRRLIPPLTPDEYKRLEEDILDHGCLDPLIVWNDILLDGHNRYEICNRHQLPYQVKSLLFESRDHALSWICTHQIGRRNVSEENRKYILGKLYEVQKRVNVRNPFGNNQYSHGKPPAYDTKYGLATDLGEKYHVSHSTIEKYARYSRAIDRLAEVSPSMLPKIMSGEVHIAMDNMVDIAKMTEQEIGAITKAVTDGETRSLDKNGIITTLIKAQDSFTEAARNNRMNAPSVKDMPAYDPDADVASLTMTIPMWQSSILRVKEKSNMAIVSERAKLALRGAFISLMNTIDNMLDIMKEE